MTEDFQVIVVGGGPAGITAGIYTCRAKLKTVLLESFLIGGPINTTDMIDNYPGFPGGIKGPELSARMAEQARRFGADMRMEEAESIKEDGVYKIVRTKDGNEYRGAAVIICTGSVFRKLNVPGEKEFVGRGVSYCATCDGAFFKDMDVAVVGGGDTALTEALFLTRFARSVTIIHRRDKLRAVRILQDKAFAEPKIKFIWNSVVKEIKGTERGVEALLLKDVKSGQEAEVPFAGVFILIGSHPQTDFIRDFVELDEEGYIITDEEMRTSREGIFAAGDVRCKQLRQVATAVGDGAVAAYSAEKYLESKGLV